MIGKNRKGDIMPTTRGKSTKNMTKEERTKYTIETMELEKTGKNVPTNQLQKSNYLDNPNTRTYHKIIREKCILSKRTCLNSVEDMEKEILEYFALADEYNAVPSILSLSNYLGINRQYLYQLANSESEFADTTKKAIELIHDIQESGALKNSVAAIPYLFIAKNYYNMSDNQTITLRPDNSNQDRSQTMEALQEVIQEQKQLEHKE